MDLNPHPKCWLFKKAGSYWPCDEITLMNSISWDCNVCRRFFARHGAVPRQYFHHNMQFVFCLPLIECMSRNCLRTIAITGKKMFKLIYGEEDNENASWTASNFLRITLQQGTDSWRLCSLIGNLVAIFWRKMFFFIGPVFTWIFFFVSFSEPIQLL